MFYCRTKRSLNTHFVDFIRWFSVEIILGFLSFIQGIICQRLHNKTIIFSKLLSSKWEERGGGGGGGGEFMGGGRREGGKRDSQGGGNREKRQKIATLHNILQ